MEKTTLRVVSVLNNGNWLAVDGDLWVSAPDPKILPVLSSDISTATLMDDEQVFIFKSLFPAIDVVREVV